MRRLPLVLSVLLLLLLLCASASADIVKDFSYTPRDHAVKLKFTAKGYDTVVVYYSNLLDKGSMTFKVKKNGRYSCTIPLPNTYPGNNVAITVKSDRGRELMKKTYVQTALEDIPPVEQSPSGRLVGVTVCIDPGHQGHDLKIYAKEPLGPGLSGFHETGNGQAQGIKTKRYESTVVLEVGLKLRNALLQEGAKVVMTREDQKTAVTNMRRAEIANENKADVFIRLHCDNAENRSARGIFVYVPATSDYAKKVADVETYYHYGEIMLKAMKKATGVTKGTVRQNGHYVASNWAKMPAFLIEIGFMSNAEDDVLISTPEFQQNIIAGMVNGIEKLCRLRKVIK